MVLDLVLLNHLSVLTLLDFFLAINCIEFTCIAALDLCFRTNNNVFLPFDGSLQVNGVLHNAGSKQRPVTTITSTTARPTTTTSSSGATTRPLTSSTTVTSRPSLPEVCRQIKFDAITMMDDGNLYGFAG
jgi:hypothetical protein